MSNVIVGFIFVLGLAMGSFLNVLIDRLPVGKGIGGRSMCDHCERVLSMLELVPVVSWIAQKGRSVCCGKRLSMQYPLVELATGLVFVVVWARLGGMSGVDLAIGILYLIISAALIVIFVADLKERIIPDYMTLVIVAGGFVIAGIQGGGVLVERIIAGLVLLGGMFALYAITRGRGMGFGDVKFAFGIGMVLGLWQGFLALYIGFITGGLIGLFMVLSRRKGLRSTIAFGPFLVFGMFVMMLYGKEVVELVRGYI